MEKSYYSLCVIFLSILICVQCLQSGKNYSKNTMVRLPKNVVPIFYDLWLWTHLIPPKKFTYDGRVTIDLNVLEKSSSIVLHADGLQIHENQTSLVTFGNNNSLPILFQRYDLEKQFYNISFMDSLEVGNYSLSLFWEGEIRDEVFGFYRSSSKVGNETRWMGITQFSVTFARRAFPCFDEPYLKAHFELHIGHYGNQKITSNTTPEKIEKTSIENYFITTLKTTPKMSTYLVGWAIHNFTFEDLVNSSSTFFRVWTRPEMTGKGFQALKEGKSIYSALESWIDIKNPISKIEHIGVPNFHFNAMENWGMITFRESVSLHQHNVTPTRTIYAGLNTMAHEYAHTWFGNLVTPEFWNVAWLKEGFATYFSYFGQTLLSQNVKNRIMDLFVIENLQDALLSDSVKHKRTMNGVGVDEVDSAMGFMDFVTYKKGAAVVRMIKELMGEKSFQNAIKSYLKDRLFDYATPTMLYEQLNKFKNNYQLDINMEEFIETYTTLPGFPLVTITRNYSSNSVEISQKRFYQNTEVEADKFNSSTWWIPLSLAMDSKTDFNTSSFGSIWLKPYDSKLTKNLNISPSEWIICDITKVGYYRVNYDEGNWNMLIDQLKSNRFTTIHQVARATLIDDSFNLARGGYLDYGIPLRLSNYLIQEIEYEPWFSAINSFNFLRQTFKHVSTIQNVLQNRVRRLIEPIYQSLMLNETKNESLRVKLLRNLILSTACMMGNPDCLLTANLMFRKWIDNIEEIIKPDFKSFVYCIGIRNGSENDWEIVFSRFIQENLHTEKELLINGLGCSKSEAMIYKFLNFSTYDVPELPKQYQISLLNAALAGNPENVEYGLEFLAHNVKDIIERRGDEFLKKVIDCFKSKITLSNNMNKLADIIRKNQNILGESAVTANTVFESARDIISWNDKYASIIIDLLK